jgi:hypothetical protein
VVKSAVVCANSRNSVIVTLLVAVQYKNSQNVASFRVVNATRSATYPESSVDSQGGQDRFLKGLFVLHFISFRSSAIFQMWKAYPKNEATF